MRLLVSLVFAWGRRFRLPTGLRQALMLAASVTIAVAAPTLSFHVIGDNPGAWPAVLSSIGLRENAIGDVLVIP